MKLEDLNIRTKFALTMILFIAVISVSFVNVEPVSAATINVLPLSYYNTAHTSLNDQIHKLISSAKNGDTLNFLGKSYGDLSLIINKSLNIISNVNTTVLGDSTGQPVFLVTGSGSRWTNITGFKIKSVNDGISINNACNITVSKNSVSSTKGTGIKVSKSTGVKIKNNTVTSSQTGISVSNTKSSNINGNKIKKSVKNGVEIQKSQTVTVSNNSISASGNHGTLIAGSNNIDLENNDIVSSQKNGINLINTNNVKINNNTICYNTFNGIFFDINVKNTQITFNNINHNQKCGIELFNSASYTKINKNNIDSNPTGIDVNFKTDDLDMSQNLITKSDGVGINIGSGYKGSSTFTVHDNAIFGSGKWEIWAGESPAPDINIGYNWYGSDDPSQVRLCPKVAKNLISWRYTAVDGVYSLVFVEGDSGNQFAMGLSGFDVGFQMNNAAKVTQTVKNGTAATSFSSTEYNLTNNRITFIPGYQNVTVTLSNAEYKNAVDSQNQNNNDNGHDGDVIGDDDNGDIGNGKSQSNGQQVNNENSAQSASTSNTDSSGSNKLQRNSAVLDGASESQFTSGQSQTTKQQSKNSQELLLDNVNNPNFWSIISLILLIAAVILVYYGNDIKSMYKRKEL